MARRRRPAASRADAALPARVSDASACRVRENPAQSPRDVPQARPPRDLAREDGARRQQPLRPDEQHDDHRCEHERVAIRPQIERQLRLERDGQGADAEAAGDRSGQAPHATDDRRDERDEDGVDADVGVTVAGLGHEQDRRDGGQQAAERERGATTVFGATPSTRAIRKSSAAARIWVPSVVRWRKRPSREQQRASRRW